MLGQNFGPFALIATSAVRASPLSIRWNELEAVVRSDVAGRGPASYRDENGTPLYAGSLRRAAEHLAEHASRVLVVTGFAVQLADRTTGETDGPLGALYLIEVLHAAGCDARLATDLVSAPLLRAGLQSLQLPPDLLIEFPQAADTGDARRAVAAYRQTRAASSEPFSHLVFIERVGPSHTAESIAAHAKSSGNAESVLAEFEQLVPRGERDRCRNMRGADIGPVTAPLHELIAPRDGSSATPPAPYTIGIVDGGNEIGCGAIPWSVLRRVVAQGPAAQIACRVATDDLVIAGVSNWGAYALAAAVAVLRGKADLLSAWSLQEHRARLAALVAAGAVDGVTRRADLSIDGVPVGDDFAVLAQIRALCSCPPAAAAPPASL